MALGIPELESDVLDICILTRKTDNGIGDRQPSTVAGSKSRFLIVALVIK